MGINNALYAGVSGLTAYGEAVRVIGDNIANVNTLGFKSQNVIFSDVLAQTVNVTRSNIANQVGNGVRIGAIVRDQSQGSIQNTTSATDMAINGNGLFAMKDPASGTVFYTRAGSFMLDKNLNLIDGQGNIVQGWKTDTQGIAVGNVTDITFANSTSQAKASTQVTIRANLDSNATPIALAFDAANPATYHFKTEATVFDSFGNQQPVSVYYTKTAANTWSWNAVVDGGSLVGGTAGVPTVVGSGNLTFDNTGALVTEVSPPLTINWSNAAPSTISIDFGKATTTDAQGITGNGVDGVVQMAGNFATTQVIRDGYSSGFIDHLETDSTGTIHGVFTNGQRRPLFQVALAHFPNDAVLSHVGNNLLQETVASGPPVMEKPGNGGMGTITPYGLEQSNVDVANEFVKLIVVQRGYEANSKTIMTTDQMLNTLMQIKR